MSLLRNTAQERTEKWTDKVRFISLKLCYSDSALPIGASLLTAVLAEVLHRRFNCADLFIDFLQAFDKDVMSLEEMAETDYCESDSNDIMPEAMTVV